MVILLLLLLIGHNKRMSCENGTAANQEYNLDIAGGCEGVGICVGQDFKSSRDATKVKEWNTGWAQVLKSATRVEIIYRNRGAKNGAQSYSFTGEPLKELIDCLSPGVSRIAEVCKCSGNPLIRFYNEKTVLMEFVLHHGEKVRMENMQYIDFVFADETRKRLNNFWNAHMLPPFEGQR